VTLERRGALAATPESVLVPWNATPEEIAVLAKDLLRGAGASPASWPVLKAPCGSRGEGISLAASAAAIAEVVGADAARATNEGPAFLEAFRKNRRGRREPAYVVQRQVGAATGRRETSRVYALVFGGRPYLYARAELRAAPLAVDDDRDRPTFRGDDDGGLRDDGELRSWFLTNGNSKAGADRRVVSDLRNDAPALFDLASACLRALRGEFHDRRADLSADDDVAFAFGAFDFIHDADGRPFLLEVNRAPAAPPDDALAPAFRDHLLRLAADLVDGVTFLDRDHENYGNGSQEPPPNWIPCLGGERAFLAVSQSAAPLA